MPATVLGILRHEAWGAQLGYPGIILDDNGEEVQGFVFITTELDTILPVLDVFEGNGYQRVLTQAKLSDASIILAYIYTLT